MCAVSVTVGTHCSLAGKKDPKFTAFSSRVECKHHIAYRKSSLVARFWNTDQAPSKTVDTTGYSPNDTVHSFESSRDSCSTDRLVGQRQAFGESHSIDDLKSYMNNMGHAHKERAAQTTHQRRARYHIELPDTGCYE